MKKIFILNILRLKKRGYKILHFNKYMCSFECIYKRLFLLALLAIFLFSAIYILVLTALFLMCDILSLL